MGLLDRNSTVVRLVSATSSPSADCCNDFEARWKQIGVGSRRFYCSKIGGESYAGERNKFEA